MGIHFEIAVLFAQDMDDMTSDLRMIYAAPTIASFDCMRLVCDRVRCMGAFVVEGLQHARGVSIVFECKTEVF